VGERFGPAAFWNISENFGRFNRSFLASPALPVILTRLGLRRGKQEEVIMKRHQILAPALTVALTGWFDPVQADPTPAGAVSCHFSGRAYQTFDTSGQGAGEVAGYFTDIEGISDPLFNGPPSEKTAFLTFRSNQFTLTPLGQNGSIQLYRVSAGTFNIYFNPKPDGNCNNPDTFSGDSSFPGNPIAHFERHESLFYRTETLGRHDVTEYLASTKPFILNGHKYDFKVITPVAVTLNETFSNTPEAGITGFPIVLPQGANCLAVANEGQDEQ
jgi:hypothetical protein